MNGAPPVPRADGGAQSDPSMEDILASIRRILSEDDPPPASDDKVLVLDESMLMTKPAPVAEEPVPDWSAALAEALAEPSPAAPALSEPAVSEPAPAPAPPESPAPAAELPPAAKEAPAMTAPAAPDQLLAPEAERAAGLSVASLMRTLAADRGLATHRGGPTIEDLVREEIRPLLKSWLDSNLPPLVERLVRAEIERLIARGI